MSRRDGVWLAAQPIWAVVVLAVGCAGESSTTAALGGGAAPPDAGGTQVTQVVECDREAGGVEGDRRVPFTPCDDPAFVGFFILHHEMAMEMARIELERGERGDVKELAARILRQQAVRLPFDERSQDASIADEWSAREGVSRWRSRG